MLAGICLEKKNVEELEVNIGLRGSKIHPALFCFLEVLGGRISFKDKKRASIDFLFKTCCSRNVTENGVGVITLSLIHI